MSATSAGIEDIYAHLPQAGLSLAAAAEGPGSFRHARHYGAAVRLSASVAGRLAARTPADRRITGIICNGGPWNLGPAKEFAERAWGTGAVGLNPIVFPATLVSTAASTAAAAAGAHGFSYVVGHDEFAFAETLRAAIQSLRHGHAERVFAIAVCAPPDPAMRSIAVRTHRTSIATAAIGFSLVPKSSPSAIAELRLDSAYGCDSQSELEAPHTSGVSQPAHRLGAAEYLGATIAARLVSDLFDSTDSIRVSATVTSGTRRATATILGANAVRGCIASVLGSSADSGIELGMRKD